MTGNYLGTHSRILSQTGQRSPLRIMIVTAASARQEPSVKRRLDAFTRALTNRRQRQSPVGGSGHAAARDLSTSLFRNAELCTSEVSHSAEPVSMVRRAANNVARARWRDSIRGLQTPAQQFTQAASHATATNTAHTKPIVLYALQRGRRGNMQPALQTILRPTPGR